MRQSRKNNIGGNLPDDAILLEQRGSWDIYCSKSERAVLVQTTDYHPGILRLTEGDLRHFAEITTK